MCLVIMLTVPGLNSDLYVLNSNGLLLRNEPLRSLVLPGLRLVWKEQSGLRLFCWFWTRGLNGDVNFWICDALLV